MTIKEIHDMEQKYIKWSVIWKTTWILLIITLVYIGFGFFVLLKHNVCTHMFLGIILQWIFLGIQFLSLEIRGKLISENDYFNRYSYLKD